MAHKEKIKTLTTSLMSVTKNKDQLRYSLFFYIILITLFESLDNLNFEHNLFIYSTVIVEYEKTISDMVSKKEDVHKEYEARISYIEDERSKMERHLQNSEMAFNDVHE